jgi:hypothetical protein
MAGGQLKLKSISTIVDKLDANRAQRFSYTQKAFDDDDIDGVTAFDVNDEQNIPVKEQTDYDDMVLDNGIRAQGASIPRMAWNHYFGRFSYNINKLVQQVKAFLGVNAAMWSHNGSEYDPGACYAYGDVCYYIITDGTAESCLWYIRISSSPDTISNIPPMTASHWAPLRLQSGNAPVLDIDVARKLELDTKAPINATLADQSESSALPATASTPLTTLLQTVRNCLKYLVNGKASLASPALTGTPTAPTAAVATNTTQIATTAFVKTVVAALVDSSPAALDTLNELAAALGDDPNFATTMTNALAGKAPINATLADQSESSALPVTTSTPLTTLLQTVRNCLKYLVNGKASLASPALTGTPTAPTAASTTNSTQIATTAFVKTAIAALATLASPALTGTPTAPTAAVGTNTTQIATTAFVRSIYDTILPVGKMVMQRFGEKTPTEAGCPGTWVQWSSRAVAYGLSTSQPSYTNYTSLVGTTIAASARPYTMYHIAGDDYAIYRLKTHTDAYSVPTDFDPVRWDKQNMTIIERVAAGNALTASDYTIGSKITSGTYANYYVWEIIVPGGKFEGIEGGNRPTYLSGGKQADRQRDHNHSLRKNGGNVLILGSQTNCIAGIAAGGGFIDASDTYQLSEIIKPASNTISTGADNAPINLSIRILRRVA